MRSGLDWNLWLGVAPARPYHPAYCPFVWRGWKDFGTGAVGDMGIHNAAMPFAALDLGPPASAEIIATSGLKPETFPVWSRLKLDVPRPRQSRPDHAFLVRRRPEASGGPGWGPQARRQRRDRCRDEGNPLIGRVDRRRLDPIARGSVPRLQAASLSVPRAPEQSHHQEWLRACRGGPPAFCRFDGFAARLTETMLVANLALRTGKIDSLGRRDDGSHGLPRGCSVHQARRIASAGEDNLRNSSNQGDSARWPER